MPESRDHKLPVIVAISGASGAIYGIRLLETLAELDIEAHLIISKSAHLTITDETIYSVEQVKKLARATYQIGDIGAAIASGSFRTGGMIIAPCSIKTMSEIATGVTPNLISRAADVTLKERRPLILMVRETPFHLGHLRTMCALTEMGAIIAPPLPAYYPKPESVDDIINHSAGRILDLMGIDNSLAGRWQGLKNG